MAQSEYSGTTPTISSVSDLGPGGRKLSSSEKLRLGSLTGQDEEPTDLIKLGFFYGVDPDYPEFQ